MKKIVTQENQRITTDKQSLTHQAIRSLSEEETQHVTGGGCPWGGGGGGAGTGGGNRDGSGPGNGMGF